MPVKHLPATLKQLLQTRSPNSLASPRLADLHHVFSKTLTDARSKPVNIERGWLVLSTCALLTANCPPAVGHLYRFATRQSSSPSVRESVDGATDKAALMREATLKSSIFVGVPRTILTLTALNEAFEDDVKASLRKDVLRQATPDSVQPTMDRGRALWDSIYEPHAQKLHDKLNGLHPDFMSFVIHSYGSVLSPLSASISGNSPSPGANSSGDGNVQVQGNISRTLTSVVGSACLRAEGRVGPQLVSHVFGLLKARDADAPESGFGFEEASDEDRWLSSDEGAEWVVRTTDIIADAVRVPATLDTPEEKAKL